MSKRKIHIGTRGSRLAMAQTGHVIRDLSGGNPDVACEIIQISTSGDRDQAAALSTLGGYGIFTKQIEQELLDRKIDLAVHSAKDLPAAMTDLLVIAAVPTRAPVNDVLIARDGRSLSDLPPGSVVGTSAPRRRAQLLNQRPDLVINDIRGNVETRLGKLERGDYDAIVMAHAGLERVGLLPGSAEPLSPDEFLPAPGQGALVIQGRADDQWILDIAAAINDPISRRCLEIERGLLRGLNAGCSAAVGGWARISDTRVALDAVVLDIDGQRRLFAGAEITAGEPDTNLVDMVVRELTDQGARELIART